MNHSFAHREIPPGKKTVLEHCVHCDLKSYRYATNARAYPFGRRECTRISEAEQNLRDKIGRTEKKLEELKKELLKYQSQAA